MADRPPRVPPHLTLNSGSRDVSFGQRPPPPYRPGTAESFESTAPSYHSHRPAGHRVYSSHIATESAELLLPPPSRSRGHHFRDREPPSPSPTRTEFSSRSSFDSDMRDSPIPTPMYSDSRSPSRSGSEDDRVTTQTVAEKYSIMPSDGLLIYPDEVEKDDYLHNPDIEDRGHYDMCTRRGLVNMGGLAFIVLGLLVLFIGYPILTFVKRFTEPVQTCASNPDCLDAENIPLFKNIRTGLIDPDTPSSAMTMTAADGTKLQLAFSDEFNKPGRTFYADDDPWWEAVDLWYGVTQNLEWYDPDAVTTASGTLEITFEAFLSHALNYRSGMLQSWNKLCFKGGRMEASMSLPGKGSVSGLWPGFWSMGNLGRPGYAATTDGMWPYSYDHVCDAGITPNQSDPDGVNYLPGMRLPACTCSGQDHPSPGRSRSSPEIDALEATVNYLGPGKTNLVGEVSQSFQVAPFDVNYLPDFDFVELYDPAITTMNTYRGGVYQQAMSGLSWMNNDWYNGNAYQKFAFEYTPGKDGQVTWFIGDSKTWKITGKAIGPNGNIGQRTISEEPMSMILNVGMSPTFATIDVAALAALFPAKLRVDYVRIYQDPSEMSVTCDPPGFETTDYIKQHAAPYHNVNITRW
ncbi:MAG: hypothetical protein M1814_002143 [Vezdaea aestivalis]|nr:MAG: hypothetical protein M1814_002143 [Vezdaea aestivalis]